MTPQKVAISCLLIWILSFAIISPAIFEWKIGGFDFGAFGWDIKNGKCEIYDCSTERLKPGGIIDLYGVVIPFLIIAVSYIALGIFVRGHHRSINADLDENDEGCARVQFTLLTLTLA